MNWLVFVVTGSAVAMGSLLAWRGLISMFLSPFGGVWADRVDRRTLIILFTAVSATEATILAVMVYTGWIAASSTPLDRALTGTMLGFLVTSGLTKAWVFFVFAFVDGIVNSMAQPTRQAFVYDVAAASMSPMPSPSTRALKHH
jgi:MFS family permease